MTSLLSFACGGFLWAVCGTIAAAQPVAPARKSPVLPVVKPLTYADVADRALAAPLVAEVRIRQAKALSAKQAQGLKAGAKRYLIAGDVITLIRGDGGIAPRITLLFDLSRDSRGKFPKLSKAMVSVLARRVPGQASEVQLISPDALFFMTPDAGMRVPAIIRAASSPDAQPRVTGISDMYHSPGPVAGEGESQIFLTTENGRPISLGVLRTPEKPPRWAVNLGESVGESTPPPAKETLLWYRLACSLPASPPESAVQSLDDAQRSQLLADYRFVQEDLGPCTRTLPPLAR